MDDAKEHKTKNFCHTTPRYCRHNVLCILEKLFFMSCQVGVFCFAEREKFIHDKSSILCSSTSLNKSFLQGSYSQSSLHPSSELD